MLRALFRSRYRMARNAFQLASARQRFGWLAMAAGWGAIAFWVVLALVTELGRARTFHEQTHALEALFFYLGMLMLISAAPLAFGAMFQAQDVSWLLASPIRPAQIAVVKLFDGLTGSARIFVPFCLPAFAASAWAFHLPFLGWIWAFFLWVGYLALIALFIQWLLAVMAQILSPQRIQVSIVALNFVLSLVLLFFFALNPGNLSQNGQVSIPLMNLPVPSYTFAPGMCAKAIYFWSRGDYWGALWNTLQVYGLAALMGGLVVMHGQEAFSDARYSEAAMQGARVGLKSRGAQRRTRPSLSEGIGRKDLLVYLREPQLLSQVAAPLLIMLLPFAFQARYRNQDDFIRVVALSLVAMTLYIQTSVLSLSSVSLEARAFWMVRTAPVGMLRFLIAKWWFCVRFVMATQLALTSLAWAAFRLPTEWAINLLLIGAVTSMTLSGLGVGLSALFPRFVYENPAQRVSVWALLWGFGLYLLYLIMVGGFYGLILYLLANTDAPPFLVWSFGLSLIGLTCVSFGLAPLVMGARRLANYEWQH